MSEQKSSRAVRCPKRSKWAGYSATAAIFLLQKVPSRVFADKQSFCRHLVSCCDGIPSMVELILLLLKPSCKTLDVLLFKL